MAKIVECVPNFSEGRRTEVIEAIANAIKGVEGTRLLDYEYDKDHNRSVMTFVGEPESVKSAAFAACAKAAELIDLNAHSGEHPRIGATDVIPFIPISNCTMEECVELARELGNQIAEELKIPVYLYENAAVKPERRNLANIRKGQYEGLKEAVLKDPERKPDYGPASLHPTAGATVVGARMPLVAYNINLNTNDLDIAKSIAKAIRHSTGGLRYVKALGLEIKERGIVQVSMNLTNYQKTSVFRVFEMVKSEAERYGVEILGSEVVGLIPMNALVDSAEFYLRIENFDKSQVLENRLWE
ncbi:MAG: glutamate formimidoyltransferase [Methanomassiliicoccales archaeon]|nr:MAG: glutamate formimidoyltransferase [Methanomassiliicoccales archaeon]